MTEIVTKTYKKSTTEKVYTLNLNAKKITDIPAVSNRVDQVQRNEAYTSVKDHKQNFQTNSSFILINPAKANILDKTILGRIYLH